MGVSVIMLNGSGRKISYILIITKRSSNDSPTKPKDKFIGFATNIPDVNIVKDVAETNYSIRENIRV